MADLPHPPDQLLDQQNAPNRSNHLYVPLDKKATIEALQIVSFAVLTMVVGLSTYSTETLAPLAGPNLIQQVLLISPYVCVIIALIGVGLSLCASESNRLADCAAMVILLVCLYGIVLGGMAAVMLLDAAPLSTVFWSTVLVIGLLSSWGWLFAYPICLKFNIRMIYWSCFNGCRSTDPWCSSYADPESGQHTDPKGFGMILSSAGAACLEALHPLDEDRSIDILKTLSRSVLTGISGLSLWAAHTVAPKAYMARMFRLERFLYGLPYFYIPLGVVAIAISASASKSNGLASCGSCLVLVLCVWGLVLGACFIVVMLHFGILSATLVAYALIISLVWVWGWLFAYPKVLNYVWRLTVCSPCAKRLNIHSVGYDGVCNCVVDYCLKEALFLRRWSHGCAICTGVEMDLEAGPAVRELTPMAEKDIMLTPEVVRMTR